MLLATMPLSLLAACVTNQPNMAATGEDPAYDKGGKAKAVKVTQAQRGVQLSADECGTKNGVTKNEKNGVRSCITAN